MKLHRTSGTLSRERSGSGSTRHHISSSRKNTETSGGYKRNQQIRKPVTRHKRNSSGATGGGFVDANGATFWYT